MLLKKKNNLIKRKRFLPLGFYVKSPLFFGGPLRQNQNPKGKSQNLRGDTLKTLSSVLNINKYSFLENNQRFKYKQIQTYFRSVISDQKKRSAFAKHELKTVVFKTLLSVNQKTFLFTRRVPFNSPKIKALKSLPMSQEAQLTTVLQLSPRGQEVYTRTRLLKAKSIEQQDAFRINQNSNSRYARLGPVLFLEKTINPLFTEKTKSFSRIRNRCLLSGRSSIVGKYRLSRICFRHYVNCGLIPGLMKNKN